MRYCKSTIFQANHNLMLLWDCKFLVVCDTAKVRFFKQITTDSTNFTTINMLFAILQKYDFSSKSQPMVSSASLRASCLRYCKSTIFQANHNEMDTDQNWYCVVCDTAKVRFFKQITTAIQGNIDGDLLFAILQKYDFSSKSQLGYGKPITSSSCLRYCKSTIFQANHNLQ